MNEFDEYLEAVWQERHLDARTAVLDVRVVKKGSRLAVVGVTTVPAAVDDLIQRLTTLKERKFIRDEVIRLPHKSLETEPHALVRASVAPVYGDPALPAPQNSQAVLGSRVEPLERTGYWCRVRLEDGYIGWVHTGYLQFGGAEWAYAWERGSRGEPVIALGAELLDDTGRVFARLPWGARVLRLSQEQYELPDGRRGTLSSGEIVAVDRIADWFPPRGDSVARTARRWIGAPYLWGGVTQAGVDCSGLVQAVMWLHGVAMPRDSDMQSRVGHRVEVSKNFAELRPGDLLFFSESHKRVTHVAISLGGPHIVHSALSNGGVEVNDLTGGRELESRMRSVFTRAHRVLPD